MLVVWGEMVNSVSPTTTSQDSAWPWKVLRRKGDGTSANHWDGVRVVAVPPCAGLSRRLVAALLFSPFIHTVYLGDYWRESWRRDLVICYLFFISTPLIYGKKHQVRQGDKTKGFPAECGFLQRAAYKSFCFMALNDICTPRILRFIYWVKDIYSIAHLTCSFRCLIGITEQTWTFGLCLIPFTVVL